MEEWSCESHRLWARAQQINLAVWLPGTRGYSALEGVDQMPCSVMTDAVSVDQTILEKLEKVGSGLHDDTSPGNHTCFMLCDIAQDLSDPNVDAR